jgi:hypothetical protein
LVKYSRISPWPAEKSRQLFTEWITSASADHFDVAGDLLVALEKVAIGDVPLKHMLGNGLQRMIGIMLEAEFPYAADR